ncbi:hypothetical protein L0156_01070 [bacterium]|nr:hypothetical protein [bacterium]
MTTRKRKRPDQAFTKRIREAFSGANDTEIARGIGLRQPVVFRYLSGEISPCYDFFWRLAQLKIDINWVLTGRSAPPIVPAEESEELQERLQRYYRKIEPYVKKHPEFLNELEAIADAFLKTRSELAYAQKKKR